MAQEFTKIVGKNAEPSFNWFCYDSQAGYGKVEQIQTERPEPQIKK
jgi:hypothetical protein